MHPRYRGQGYGHRIWQHAMNYGSQKLAALDGVVEQQENYKKSGFHFAYNLIRHEHYATHTPDLDKHVTPAKLVKLIDILNYLKAFSISPRDNFLTHWLFASNAKSLVYLVDNKVLGLGTIREASSGFRVGPLFANHHDIAEQLLLGLANYADRRAVYLDIPDINEKGIALANKHNMHACFETARMYTSPTPPDLSINKVYGNTSLEVG